MSVFLTYVAMALGVAVTLFLVVVGLVNAPWPLLLAGLLLSLYALQKVSVPDPDLVEAAISEPELLTKTSVAKVSSSSAEDTRQNHATPSQPVVSQNAQAQSGLVEGTYRGQRWQRPAENVPSSPTQSIELIYRGCKVRPSKPDQPSS